MDKKRIIVISVFILIFLIAIIASLAYYNDKYSIYFETGTSEIILTQYVKRHDKATEPSQPTKEGYIFKEWQLNGEKYNFDTEVVSDTILTAKWVKEEYITINFDTNSEYNIKPKRILKGDIIDELPDSIKENYEFIGWYLNDELYNNEEIYDDVTLMAQYRNETINTTYKVGDKIKIIGKYSSSAKSTNAYNKKAIGWERKIINIIEGAEYPYVVGNENGVTGFFKANSLVGIGSE